MRPTKHDIDFAEDILRTYERAMRDRKIKGHCLSAEWRYNANPENKRHVSTPLRYPPEVFDMVKDVLSIMAAKNHQYFAVLRTQYSYISPYYKRPNRAALQKRQRARNNSSAWFNEVECALAVFWELLQKHTNFKKYLK